MALTPLDIHNKEFRVKLRGYDQDEVNDFLDQIIKDYEMTLKDNSRLTESLKQNQEKLKYFNDLKDSLNQSIIVAQEAADRVKSNSQREADITKREAQKQAEDVISEAHEKAHEIIEQASQKAKRLIFETDDLKKQARIFRQKLQVMLESQLEVVKGSEWDDILRQGDTSDYEAIQEVIRRDEDLDKQAAKAVQSVSNSETVEPTDDEAAALVSEDSTKKAVVIFPDEEDEGQHFSEDSQKK
ncbi:MAG: DivIVA domain-containing protein [Liquorilactobacillus nagelii]|jgi:cell division initiation protein|uniref:Cell division protein DivIVA n=2 Tax=Liquorilactobacillus nagelii TaxID=82688 RepID=A0A3Q8CZI6_9LACO|nr:DivIVA domain-containing protein [Liquorilactobacillus nagelii]AUJ32338.1 cell division protein DivIVA [Liquorilactobacillus nagelii]KRL40096.1 cell division initiation protein [Liquorilactobacillus nagelii DSM 13675]MCC7615520.1 cell division protein DivIVA [Liquorilactobacillus nagelii]MCI1634477.1 DivIVA domain-containing protein [Liquorilactobacillus nagelii]MCI1920392.1 DivIVA domain-containing protein [Liquorilactobacillus nagelii]